MDTMTITFRKLLLFLCVISFASVTLGLCVYVHYQFGEHPELAWQSAYKTTSLTASTLSTMLLLIFSGTLFYDVAEGNLK